MASSCLRVFAPSSSRSLSIVKNARTWAKRGLHTRRELPYPTEGGVGKFLPPSALKTLVEYQDGLLARLDEELQTDPRAEKHSSVAQIAINYATLKERVLGFNYAVLALNNSFFLDQLSPPPQDRKLSSHEDKISPELTQKIAEHYGDLTHLKSTFSAAALGMFSNGWVWLVADQDGNLGVLPTFGPSTLLVRMRRNMHYNVDSGVLGEDPAVALHNSLPTAYNAPFSSSASGGPAFPTSPFQARSLHTTSRRALPFGEELLGEYDQELDYADPKKGGLLSVGSTLYPLLCLSVYEHAWMSGGYGVWGKEAWLKEFWSVVDWSKVSRAYANVKPSVTSPGSRYR
ncbi:hypothetical protein D9619_001056 [Psilocybe cf. subviscida]|uniref:Manganese/iron superoxide dismutase C-terminal domain-containing protein n=1 Tax=Psilocybe cf. subviscida TaxID=2480587 RepID=A0A8H5BGC8_9AGAR|nr:hypothetical protein D9619_001056 [Psilocybe cf. subviscida]